MNLCKASRSPLLLLFSLLLVFISHCRFSHSIPCRFGPLFLWVWVMLYEFRLVAHSCSGRILSTLKYWVISPAPWVFYKIRKKQYVKLHQMAEVQLQCVLWFGYELSHRSTRSEYLVFWYWHCFVGRGSLKISACGFWLQEGVYWSLVPSSLYIRRWGTSSATFLLLCWYSLPVSIINGSKCFALKS